ncbi:MAG: twin-arginine translocation signal domain-containing protein [Desulfobacterales bacterium]|nr:twin-arginine translocation signal domain-containing protein [Desulfobacterales bacterium]
MKMKDKFVMDVVKDGCEGRRKFLKGAGLVSAAALFGAVPLLHAETESREAVIGEYWDMGSHLEL